jgi:hypothetical protein
MREGGRGGGLTCLKVSSFKRKSGLTDVLSHLRSRRARGGGVGHESEPEDRARSQGKRGLCQCASTQ